MSCCDDELVRGLGSDMVDCWGHLGAELMISWSCAELSLILLRCGWREWPQEPSGCVERSSKWIGRVITLCSKLSCPIAIIDGEESAWVMSMYMHCVMHQLRCWGPQIEHFPLDGLRPLMKLQATMMNVEGETASYSDDALGSGSVDGTASSSGVHSMQVKAVLLSSWDGQHMHYSQRVWDKNLPHCIVWATHPTLNLSR